ncbi:hypothetical protein SLA2020_412760 [Shorea laevis]
MTTVPQEIITAILYLLPVKPLIRFQCLSKPWCALINDPYFIKLHLHRSIETDRESTLILEGIPGYYYYLVNFSNEDRNFGEAVKIKEALHRPKECTGIIDSCNGLVCIRNWLNEIAIWNPLIRKYRKLPVPTEDSVKYNLAFGYDRVNDDYKVLRIPKFCRLIEVYSLRVHSWRRVEEEWPYSYRESSIYSRSAFLNGAFHWVVSLTNTSYRTKTIVAFDLSTEKFRVYAFPHKLEPRIGVSISQS